MRKQIKSTKRNFLGADNTLYYTLASFYLNNGYTFIRPVPGCGAGGQLEEVRSLLSSVCPEYHTRVLSLALPTEPSRKSWQVFIIQTLMLYSLLQTSFMKEEALKN